MYRRYGPKKRRYGAIKRYGRYNKSKFTKFRSGGKHRRLYKSFRRYKKFKRSGFRFAQRRYQITKYRVPNVAIPDELVMTFKWNQAFDTTQPTNRFSCPSMGMDAYYLDEVTGWKENALNYDTVEFLYGKMSISYYNCRDTLIHNTAAPIVTIATHQYPAFIGMMPIRRWVDQNDNIDTEKVPAHVTSSTAFFQATSEYPGYKMKVVNTMNSGKYVKGFKTSFSQKSWSNLKAKRTGFQVQLPIVKPANPYENYVPQNSAIAYFDYYANAPGSSTISGLSTATLTRSMVLAKYKFTVRFKGKKLIAPV